MLTRFKAWAELRRMVGLRYLRYKKHADAYYKGNVLRVLRAEGWFDYLKEPRTLAELADYYDYVDLSFLKACLTILVKDNTLQLKTGQYQNGPKLADGLLLADTYLEEGRQSVYLTDTLLDIYAQYANALPARFKGQRVHFLAGANLFNWDDALTRANFEMLWRCAFAFADPLRKPGRWLHAGCYNGYITAAIWVSCFERGWFDDPDAMQIVAIHHDADLISIASEEFHHLVREFCQNNRKDVKELTEQIQSHKDSFPTFAHHSVEAPPFKDCSFDTVYLSQMLQWVNTEQALREAVRVTKPGGLIFGDQTFLGVITDYNNLLYQVIQGATGHVTKQVFLKYLEQAGIARSQVAISTPASVFKLTKLSGGP